MVTPMLVSPMSSQTLQLILRRQMGHYATGSFRFTHATGSFRFTQLIHYQNSNVKAYLSTKHRIFLLAEFARASCPSFLSIGFISHAAIVAKSKLRFKFLRLLKQNGGF